MSVISSRRRSTSILVRCGWLRLCDPSSMSSGSDRNSSQVITWSLTPSVDVPAGLLADKVDWYKDCCRESSAEKLRHGIRTDAPECVIERNRHVGAPVRKRPGVRGAHDRRAARKRLHLTSETRSSFFRNLVVVEHDEPGCRAATSKPHEAARERGTGVPEHAYCDLHAALRDCPDTALVRSVLLASSLDVGSPSLRFETAMPGHDARPCRGRDADIAEIASRCAGPRPARSLEWQSEWESPTLSRSVRSSQTEL